MSDEDRDEARASTLRTEWSDEKIVESLRDMASKIALHYWICTGVDAPRASELPPDAQYHSKSFEAQVAHLLFVAAEAERLLTLRNREECMRRFGYVQGAAWVMWEPKQSEKPLL